MALPAEVVRTNRFGGLHFDPDDLAGVVLHDHVDLMLVAIPVVAEPQRRLRPSQLPTELTQDEVFHQAAEGRISGRSGRQVARQPAVNKSDLRDGDRPVVGLAAHPGRRRMR